MKYNFVTSLLASLGPRECQEIDFARFLAEVRLFLASENQLFENMASFIHNSPKFIMLTIENSSKSELKLWQA